MKQRVFKLCVFALCAALLFSPVKSSAFSTTTAMDLSFEFGAYRSPYSAAYAFGINYSGRLGNGLEATGMGDDYVLSPSLFMLDVKQIVASQSAFYTLYIKTDNSLWGAGTNFACQLGDGTTETRTRPVKILDNVMQAAAGDGGSAALTFDGDLYVWGTDVRSFFKNQNMNCSVPQKIATDVKEVSYSGHHLAYIKKDGRLFTSAAFGNQEFTTPNDSPAVPGIHMVSEHVSFIAATTNALFYVDESGALWAAGLNEYGRMIKVRSNRTLYEPIKIVNSGVEKVLDTGGTLFYLTYDGTLYAAGMNEHGIMGLGWEFGDATSSKYSDSRLYPSFVFNVSTGEVEYKTYTEYSYPVFEVAKNVTDFAAGSFNACYITADGKTFLSGENAGGDYSTSLYFIERPDMMIGENEHGTLINRVGPYRMRLTVGANVLSCIDKNIGLDVPAQLIQDRVMVPLRAVFEALNAEVTYEEDTRTITSKKDSTKIVMKIGETAFTMNGEKRTMDVPPQAADGRTLIPLRAVAECFGCGVSWDDETQTAVIK